MAFGFTTGPTYGSTAPTAQGTYGSTSGFMAGEYNPNAPRQGDPLSSYPGAPTSGGSSSPTYQRSASAPPSGSPVLSNGQIPPPAPAQPTITSTPAPAPLTLAQREAAVGIEDRGNNMVFVPAYGGVVDRNHPIYTSAMQAAPAAGSPTPAAGGTPAAAPFDPTKLQQAPAPTYQPATFSQFVNPTNPLIDQAADAQVLGLIQNPYTMTPQHVSILQEQGKEGILAQQMALQQALAQQRAQSGFAPGGGMEQAGQRRISDATGSALTASNRDIELQKLARDRADLLAAIQAASGYQGNRLNQGIGAYGATLQGQQAQSGEDYRGYASQFDAYNNANDVALRAQALAVQKALGEAGVASDAARLAESGRQYNLGYGLNQAQLLNEMLMGRLAYGLNLGNLEQNAQNALFSQLFR